MPLLTYSSHFHRIDITQVKNVTQDLKMLKIKRARKILVIVFKIRVILRKLRIQFQRSSELTH